MKTKKRILVAPLDWGIGHATRCIPIIKELKKNGYEVVLAADNRPLHLLNKEFPKLEIIRFKGYNIKYSKYLSMPFNMLMQIPKLLWNIKSETKELDEIINNYNIDGVISDNRFGLFSSKIPCIFITHQLEIIAPYLKKKIRDFNYSFISKFDACWIFDHEKNNLAGRLSKPKDLPKNSTYIGNHSRFSFSKTEKKYDFLAIVSGPEPQRTILENGLTKALRNRHEKSLILLGKPEQNINKNIGNLTIKSHLDATELNQAILQSKLIICRSGYSTIMDLKKLGSKAFLIPTPGQTEQEYLAEKLESKNICYYQNQEKFDFEKGIAKCKEYSGFTLEKEDLVDWKELFRIFS
ncbi:MAG: glycosyltransferase [Flavobacteriales bacterium]|nr:glycosyltransferase [Flavobacteriales bacterium]